MMSHDPHSAAMPEQAVVKHLSLNLEVDFSKKILMGTATWQIETAADAEEIYFDTRGLTIKNVWLNDTVPADFVLADEQNFIGRPLNVLITPQTKSVKIAYQTSPDAAAIQWLSPQQTDGKNFPFMFTQSQAILARTWIPCQDSPGIRFTYDATIHCPKELLALMSAENPTEKNDSGVYHFKMPQAIPSYLMALSVGNLQFESVGKITGVYAEPTMLKKAVWEFADMQKMVDNAEALYGPYEWGRYDVLVLPPSFPFGGMENPRLTFATPTIIAGDRSLVSLIAHELAHSWSGNLVTNANWNDFWLNEGFTVYFEERIMEALYGRDYSEMLAILGRQGLNETVKDLGEDNADTKLKLHLDGRDPDDGMNLIAYQKGYYFLRLLEETVGRKAFDNFVNQYFSSHKFQSVTTEQFLNYLEENLIEPHKEKFKNVNVDQWVYQCGVPQNCPVANSTMFTAVDAQAAKFLNGADAATLQTENWNTHQWIHFISNLPASLTIDRMKNLDAAFHFTESNNAEIEDCWFLLSIKTNYETAYASMQNFLVHVGRRKFLMPLYKEMNKTADGKKLALHIYTQARPNYHSVAVSSIDEMLGWK